MSCAIPMGWTHSLAVCQAVLEGLARQVDGVAAENALVDRQLAPDINPMIHTEYADNFESYPYDEKLVATAAREVESRLNDAGLPHTTSSSLAAAHPSVGTSPRPNPYLASRFVECGDSGWGCLSSPAEEWGPDTSSKYWSVTSPLGHSSDVSCCRYSARPTPS